MKIFTDKCCESLLMYTGDSALRSCYQNENFNSQYFEYLKQENSIEISSIVLDSNPDSDCENSIKIFEAMKGLDLVQANDRRLWVTLTHTVFFDYSRDRWSKDDDSDKKILRRFHFNGSSLETRMRNSLSRLWWAARISYDEGLTDPYFLTKILWSKQDIYQNLVERSYGTYESVVRGFLEFYSKNPFLSEDSLRKLFTALNSIGGVKVLSIHSKAEIIGLLENLVNYYDFKKVA